MFFKILFSHLHVEFFVCLFQFKDWVLTLASKLIRIISKRLIYLNNSYDYFNFFDHFSLQLLKFSLVK